MVGFVMIGMSCSPGRKPLVRSARSLAAVAMMMTIAFHAPGAGRLDVKAEEVQQRQQFEARSSSSYLPREVDVNPPHGKEAKSLTMPAKDDEEEGERGSEVGGDTDSSESDLEKMLRSGGTRNIKPRTHG